MSIGQGLFAFAFGIMLPAVQALYMSGPVFLVWAVIKRLTGRKVTFRDFKIIWLVMTVATLIWFYSHA